MARRGIHRYKQKKNLSGEKGISNILRLPMQGTGRLLYKKSKKEFRESGGGKHATKK